MRSVNKLLSVFACNSHKTTFFEKQQDLLHVVKVGKNAHEKNRKRNFRCLNVLE